MAKTLNKPLNISVAIALFITLLLVLFANTSLSKRLEQVSYDYHLSHSRENTEIPDQVMIILIDEASLKQMDQVVGRWPWPRSIYHELINYISTGQPKAIMFDILFAEKELANSNNASDETSNDKLLIQATATQPHIHHAMQLIPSLISAPALDAEALTPLISQRHGLDENITKKLFYLQDKLQYGSFEDAITPITDLAAASSQLGVVTATPDNDGIYRRTQLFFKQANSIFPSLSIAPLISETAHMQTVLDHHHSIYKLQYTDVVTTVPINFYADYRPISIVYVLDSISNLYAGEMEKIRILPNEFTGKYVFIGASAIGLHDLKPTSISKLAPGVFIHAAMLGNIISNDLLVPTSKLSTVIIIFLVALMTAFAVIRIKQQLIQSTIPIIVGLCYLFISLTLIENNRIINFTLPVLAIISSWILAYLFLFTTEKKQKRNIRNMFSRYVSPAALSCMEDKFQNYRTLGHGSEEIVSVLFSDIRGFTGLSEQSDAREIVTVLNYYFSTMTDVIFKHQGTVDKFIGDAIMATWGAPITSPHHARDAVRAAIDMNFAIDSVNNWLEARKLTKINVGIGVHTGTAIMGSIGSSQKADFTVIGDTVNLASRLEGITKLYQTPIIISGSSYAELQGEIPC